MPRPSSLAAGTTSCSMPRLSSEYSTWVETSGARPGTARCQVAACAVRQPGQFETPTYAARPVATAVSSADSVSSMGSCRTRRAPATGPRESTPSRSQRQVEAAQQVAARGVHHPAAAAHADPGLGRHDHVAARDHVAEQPAEQLLRRAAGVGVRGVEQGAARVHEGGQLLAGLVLVGLVAPGHQPRPSRETARPERPRDLCCTRHTVAARWPDEAERPVQARVRRRPYPAVAWTTSTPWCSAWSRGSPSSSRSRAPAT